MECLILLMVIATIAVVSSSMLSSRISEEERGRGEDE